MACRAWLFFRRSLRSTRRRPRRCPTPPPTRACSASTAFTRRPPSTPSTPVRGIWVPILIPWCIVEVKVRSNQERTIEQKATRRSSAYLVRGPFVLPILFLVD